MNSTPPHIPDPPQRPPSDRAQDPAEISSEAILRGARMVVINHRGERYRLFETRNGKLVLQK